MIQTLSKLGALYKHEEYQTLSTLWNTYPWVLGSDNRLEQEIELEDFYSDKTIFEEEENLSSFLFNIENFTMTALLIRIDNLGNFGKAVDNPPDPFPLPKEWLRTAGPTVVTFSNIISQPVLIIQDSNSEASNEPMRTVGPTVVTFKNIISQETLVIRDSNSETSTEPMRTVGPINVTFKNIISEQV